MHKKLHIIWHQKGKTFDKLEDLYVNQEEVINNIGTTPIKMITKYDKEDEKKIENPEFKNIYQEIKDISKDIKIIKEEIHKFMEDSK